MKMRFWQKTYIFTLILFLVCLNAGVLSLAAYTHKKNTESAETSASAEQYYIAASFERDFDDLLKINENADISLLMQTYSAHYGSDDLHIAFKKDGKETAFDTPVEYETDTNSIVHRYIGGKRYIIISTAICGGEYELIAYKNASYLDKEYHSLMFTYTLVSLGISAFLAVLLYFVLKRLSGPLETLRATTEKIESGDFSAKVKEKGSDEFTLVAKSFNLMLTRINEQISALERAAEEKEKEAEQKQMLVDNMAHEIRTPLTSIHGYAEFLEKASADEERRIVSAKYIVSETERMQKISEILLNEAYIRENDIEMSNVSLKGILSDTVSRFEEKAKEKNAAITSELSDTTVLGNETLLSMLFCNLTENALKACSTGGKVSVSCYENTAVIKDTGKGMTKEQLDHITEPFYRTDKSRSRAEGGVGLGLSLCSMIVKKHGADMRFVSEPGKGTEITITFTSGQ